MAKIETLMIKAIKEFNKTHKGCEIRGIYPLEASGKGKRYTEARFGVEYVNEENQLRNYETLVTA